MGISIKLITLLTLVVTLGGCSSNPAATADEKFGVTKINNQGLYKAYDYHWASIPSAITAALNMAANYCENDRKETLVQSSRGWYSSALTGRGSVVFACLEYGASDSTNLRQISASYWQQRKDAAIVEAKLQDKKETKQLLERSVKAQEDSARAQLRNSNSRMDMNCTVTGNNLNCSQY